MIGPRARVALIAYFAPTRFAVFEELSRLVDLDVLLYSNPMGVHWPMPEGGLDFPHQFVESAVLRGRYARDESGRRNRRSEYRISPRVLRSLDRHRPDAVIAPGFSFPSLYSSIYASVRRARYLIVSESTSETERSLGAPQRFARHYLLGRADGAIGVSNRAQRRFIELGMPQDRVFMAPYALDPSAYRNLGEARSREVGRCRFLYVGRLTAAKGVDLLLRAFRDAQEVHPEIELCLVGKGPDETQLRGLAAELGIEDRVEFAGFRLEGELAMEYSLADAFVFPTLHDPFGMVLLEAAAAGLPLVASVHAGATEDLVTDRVNGYQVDPEDTEHLAAQMSRLAAEPEARLRMGAAARDAIRDRTPAAAARELATAVTVAIQRPRRKR